MITVLSLVCETITNYEDDNCHLQFNYANDNIFEKGIFLTNHMVGLRLRFNLGADRNIWQFDQILNSEMCCKTAIFIIVAINLSFYMYINIYTHTYILTHLFICKNLLKGRKKGEQSRNT